MKTRQRATVVIKEVNHERYNFRVWYPGPGGKAKQRYFYDATEAELFAEEKRKDLGDYGLQVGAIDEKERAAVMFWRSFVSSMEDVPPPPLMQVLVDFSERWKAERAGVSVTEAVDRYEAAKQAEGLRPLSLQAINTRCRQFVNVFGERSIASITTSEISDWILGLKAAGRGKVKAKAGRKADVGLQTKRNHRLAISGLFSFAKSRGWVEINPVTDAARPRVRATRPAILFPDDVARFFSALEAKAPELIPFWALRFFAGIREQECLRMDWGMIDLDAGEIHLPDHVAKTGRSRTVAILPTLRAFLERCGERCGPVALDTTMKRRWPLKMALRHIQEQEAEAIEAGHKVRAFPVPLPANVARHSFATYHLLAFRHAGETSIQLGHGGSPEMLHRHYKGMATEAHATAFWSIRPGELSENVVEIHETRKSKAAPAASKSKPTATRKAR